MNPYTVSVVRHPKRRGGWLVVLEFTIRRFHYKHEAEKCARDAETDVNKCSAFYPYEEAL